MHSKVNPISYRSRRTDYQKFISSTWFYSSKKMFANATVDDHIIREIILSFYSNSRLNKIEIFRYDGIDLVKIVLHTDNEGGLIGKAGSHLKTLKSILTRASIAQKISINIKKAENSDELTAASIARTLRKTYNIRTIFRKNINYITNRLNNEALGYKIKLSGRIWGSDKTKTICFKQGRMPLTTISANIEYHFTPLISKYGSIGIKVWLYKK
jgi:small subunit ribosomal protein S3